MKHLFKSFWFNLLAIIVLGFVLYFAFFASLSRITQHGQELTIPELKGKNYQTALKELEQLGFDIVVDSAFDTTMAPAIILDVQPEAGSMVKKGRSIYVTINRATPPEVDMPNLLNLSFRSAQLLLESNKLVLGDTSYRPDMANGAVLEQRYNGKIIIAGQKLPQGAKVDIVIGAGYGNRNILVPHLLNLTFSEAKTILDSLNLFYTEVWDGRITDSSTAVIYFQMPTTKNEQGYPNHILEGENIDIRIRQEMPVADSNIVDNQ
jgi:beta-lactam-binding protein with PASTA domain